MPLTQQELSQFHRDGCVAIHNYLSRETLHTLNSELALVLQHQQNHPKVKFTTELDTDGHIKDSYFLSSSDKIHYFLEPKAWVQDKLTVPAEQSINKIGHGLHFLNEKFESITVNDDIASICRQLGFKDARAVQSMVVLKQPFIGAPVPPHNDAEFLYTSPSSCVGFWFALQDCTLENGCLQYIPGSQKWPLKKRFVKDKANGNTKFVQIDNLQEAYVEGGKYADIEHKMANDELYKDLIIPAGSLVLIDGNLIHKSGSNESNHSRNAYTFHVIEGKANYDEHNWLQIPHDKPAGSKNFTPLYTNWE